MKKTIKIFSILLTSAFIFQSCISTNKFTEVVKSKVHLVNDTSSWHSSSITLNTPALDSKDSLIEVQKVKSYFIPAILYWGWNRTYTCSIDNKYFINTFKQILEAKAKEFNIEKHLGDRKLEITLVEIPASFTYTKSGYFFFAIYAYGYAFQEAMYPDEKKYKVSYCIKDGESCYKQSVFENAISIPMPNQYGTATKLTEKFLDNMNENFTKQSHAMLDTIIDELY